jgi:hypothetical protein
MLRFNPINLVIHVTPFKIRCLIKNTINKQNKINHKPGIRFILNVNEYTRKFYLHKFLNPPILLST